MAETLAFENKFRWIVQRIPLNLQDFRTSIDVRVDNFDAFHSFFALHPHDMYSGMEACKRVLNDRWKGQDFMCQKYHKDKDGAFQFEFCGVSIFVSMRSRSVPTEFEGTQRHVCILIIRGADVRGCGCCVC